MVLQAATIFGAALVSLLVGSIVATRLGLGFITKTLVQMAGMAIAGAVLAHVGYIGALGVVAFALTPLLIKILIIIFALVYRRAALKGRFGEESQWAAELIREGDEEFRQAARRLPETDLREVGIVAESKEELRDLTIERYEQYQDNSVDIRGIQ